VCQSVPPPSDRFECFHYERPFSLKSYYTHHGISKSVLIDHVNSEFAKYGDEYYLVLGKADFIAEENKETGNPHNIEMIINVFPLESNVPPSVYFYSSYCDSLFPSSRTLFLLTIFIELCHAKKTLPLPKKSETPNDLCTHFFPKLSPRDGM
jgi:hypothetical protein